MTRPHLSIALTPEGRERRLAAARAEIAKPQSTAADMHAACKAIRLWSDSQAERDAAAVALEKLGRRYGQT